MNANMHACERLRGMTGGSIDRFFHSEAGKSIELRREVFLKTIFLVIFLFYAFGKWMGLLLGKSIFNTCKLRMMLQVQILIIFVENPQKAKDCPGF